MSRVLVTGGTGFVGAPNPALDFVQPGLSGATECLAADIRDPATVRAAIAGGDRAVHLAGVMTVDCTRDPVAPEGADAWILAGETADMDDFVAALRGQVAGAAVTIDRPPLRIPAEIGPSTRPAFLAGVPRIGLADDIAHYRTATETAREQPWT